MWKIRTNYWGKIILLMLLFVGVGYRINFAVDTFWTFYVGYDYAASDMLMRNGRPIIALMYKIFALTNLKDEVFYYISFIMAFVLMGAAIALYEKILRTYIVGENLRIICSLLCILNLYAIEYFMFIEKGGFALAIFCNVLAVYYIDGYLQERKLIKALGAIISVLVATLTYQGTIPIFFILSLPIIYKKANTWLDYIKNFLILVIVYWIPVGIDLLLFGIFFDATRNSSGESMVEAITEAYDVIIYSYKTTYNLTYPYLYLIWLCLVVVVSLASVIRKHDNILKQILNILVIFITVTILPVASILASTGWGTPRIIYPMASGVGIYAVNYLANIYDGQLSFDVICRRVIYLICLFFTLVEFASYTRIYIDKYKMNYADYVRIQEIGQAIDEYEMSTGNKIKQIAFYRDHHHDYPYYSNLYYEGDLVVSSFHSWDSQLNAINYYLGREYSRCLEDDSYVEYFDQMDWTCYSPMQIICDYDTLHYCVY